MDQINMICDTGLDVDQSFPRQQRLLGCFRLNEYMGGLEETKIPLVEYTCWPFEIDTLALEGPECRSVAIEPRHKLPENLE